MSESIITGQEKYRNYAEQFSRLNRALKNEFYLEAIFIEYAILEDRTESVLTHAGLWEKCRKKHGKKPGIEAKLKFIRDHATSADCSLHKYFSDDLTDRLLVWKDKRNPLIHTLLKQKLGPTELQDVALEGDKLVRILRSRATAHNRAADQKNGVSEQ